MEEKLFVAIFEKHCVFSGCSDLEIRICKAVSREKAYEMAWEHRNKFLPDWTFSVNDINWDLDNTAYVYYIQG